MADNPQRTASIGKARRAGKAKQAAKPKESPLANFGKHLRELRLKRNIHTQAEAAKQLEEAGVECSASRLQQYEQGEINDPDQRVLWKLAEIYEADGWDLIDRLCRDKYKIPDSYARLRSDEVGEVYISPDVPIAQINDERRLVEGWFFLHRTELDEPYVQTIVNLVERGVKLTFWIPNERERENHKEAVQAAVLGRLPVERARFHINTYLKYEAGDRLDKMFPPSPVSSERRFEAVSEVYFFGGPQLDPDPLLAYWTIPGFQSVRALFVCLAEKPAKEHFEKHREFISTLPI